MNLSTKQKEERCVVVKVQGTLQVWGEMKWEFGVSRSKLLYMEQISNKVPLYSSENCIQYSMTNRNGKEYGKEYMHIRVFFVAV